MAEPSGAVWTSDRVMMNERHDIEQSASVDWAGTCRLALVVSIVAALTALALVAVLPETTIIVAIIVAGTAASWYQLERRPVRAGS